MSKKTMRNAKKAATRSSKKKPTTKPRKIKSNATKGDDVCATVGCDAPAAMTYLGRPRCQACFEADTAEGHVEHVPAMAEPAINPTVEIITGQPLPAETAEAPTTKRRAKRSAEPQPKRVSALDAAAQVLQAGGEPMRTKDLIVAMAAQGLWTSPGGKTPEATLYAAMMREINAKGEAARFRRVERGQFVHIDAFRVRLAAVIVAKESLSMSPDAPPSAP